jgi:hypothetical protein
MLENELKSTLNEVAESYRYKRVSYFEFHANWPGCSIEHLLFFRKYDGRYMHAEFGIRDMNAQQFAITCVAPFMPFFF